MIDDKAVNYICYLIIAHILHMKSATLNDGCQLRFSRGYP